MRRTVHKCLPSLLYLTPMTQSEQSIHQSIHSLKNIWLKFQKPPSEPARWPSTWRAFLGRRKTKSTARSSSRWENFQKNALISPLSTDCDMRMLCSDGCLHPRGEMLSDPQQADIFSDYLAPKPLHQPSKLGQNCRRKPSRQCHRWGDAGLKFVNMVICWKYLFGIVFVSMIVIVFS